MIFSALMMPFGNDVKEYKKLKKRLKDMRSKELVSNLIKESGNSLAGVAKVTGKTTQGVWNMIYSPARKSLTVESLSELLDVLGYKVVVVPKGMNIKNGYEVEE